MKKIVAFVKFVLVTVFAFGTPGGLTWLAVHSTTEDPAIAKNKEILDFRTNAWQQLDDALKADLSGSLAALALTAAAFVVSLLPQLEKDLSAKNADYHNAKSVLGGYNHGTKEYEAAKLTRNAAYKSVIWANKRITAANDATRFLVFAFGSFLAGMICNLTVDGIEEAVNELHKWFIFPLDLATSVSTMSVGVYFLIASAIRLSQITSPPGVEYTFHESALLEEPAPPGYK